MQAGDSTHTVVQRPEGRQPWPAVGHTVGVRGDTDHEDKISISSTGRGCQLARYLARPRQAGPRQARGQCNDYGDRGPTER